MESENHGLKLNFRVDWVVSNKTVWKVTLLNVSVE